MNPGGLFKHLIWIAPVTAIMYYLISFKQDVHSSERHQENAQFDSEFAAGMGSLSKDHSDKDFWEGKGSDAEKRLSTFAKVHSEDLAKDEQLRRDMEKSLNEMDQQQAKGEN